MSKTVSAPALAAAILEKSTPIYLVEIALDSGTKYFAQNNAAVVFPTSGGHTYNAWGLTFSRVRSTLTNEIDRVTFAFDNTDLAFSGYLAIEEFQGRSVTLKRVFSNLLASAADATTVFYGEIGELTIDESAFQFVAVSPLIRLNLQVPRRMFQPNCSWVFDSAQCRGYNVAGTVAGTTLAAQETDGVVESGSTTIQVKDAAHRNEAADYWRKGRVTFTSGTLNGRSAEIASSTATGYLNLIVPLPSAPAAGVTYSITRGCNKSPSECIRKFNNYHNFGGFTAIPEKEIV